jgi:phosphoglycerate dehydrogenase-like enzyme
MTSRPVAEGVDAAVSFRVGLSADFCDELGTQLYPDLGLALLDGVPGLSYEFLREYRMEYVPEQLNGFDVLISLKPRVTAASLRGSTRLCAIGRCGVGYDNVDLEACTLHDIAVYITPAGVVRPVAESIVLFVLALSHNLASKDRLVRRGEWPQSTRRLGREPRGRVVGTIGLGNIASEAVRLLHAFDVARFVTFDPFLSAEHARRLNVEILGSLEELLQVSDYVLVNCPLNTQTRGMLSDKQFELMKPGAFLINTARGPIVDETALVRALDSGKIAGAALDVFEKEPLAADSPLTKMDQVILTSHSIAWTEELFRDMGRLDCEGALAIHRGDVPANVVNQDVLSRTGFLRKLEQYKAASDIHGTRHA